MERKIINYIVVCINEFALSKNLTEQEAFRYLYANKGIEFLTENYDIMKAAGADKKLHLYGVVFTTDKFGTNESLSFTNFRFTSQKETNKNDRYWLDAAADSKWYNWDPIRADLKFIITRMAFYS